MSARTDSLKCSFCGEGEDEVLVLAPGPVSYICDACAESRQEIVPA